MTPLRAIGFWRVPRHEWRADTQDHVYVGWEAGWTAYPQAIVAALGPANYDISVRSYLRNAQLFEAYRGLSYCRFKCGVSNQDMGCREFTDGIWVWPEGLVHYVERHQLPLPQEFLETIAENSGCPPNCNVDPDAPVDREFWEAWFARVTAAHG